jgi:drug/metabolite transporter superfamily protein YnfA
VWFSLDLIILYQLLRFGPREFLRLPKKLFYGMVALALSTAFFTVVAITLEFEDFDGVYSAFGGNLLMSVLFIVMLHSRESLRGQSLSIALPKMGSTTLASVAFLFFSEGYERSVLLPFQYCSILLFDVIYVAMVYYAARHAAVAEAEHKSGTL